jgi:hypothetical protein
MKHKHYDMIVAWAEGKTIQNFNDRRMIWENLTGDPYWVNSFQYRIKPKSEINMIVQPVGVAGYNGEVMWEDSKNPPVGTIIYALKSAEVL